MKLPIAAYFWFLEFNAPSRNMDGSIQSAAIVRGQREYLEKK
ncbi:MAG TPA: hypothetical protein VK909_06510 [Anaerolineales bacterium]|nr:hypothetical protein [Anaerolineales bacterium]